MSTEDLFKKFDNDIAKRNRFMRFLLVFDQMCNVLLWNGSQDETISSNIGRRQVAGKATWFDNAICSVLKRIQGNHCFISRGE